MPTRKDTAARKPARKATTKKSKALVRIAEPITLVTGGTGFLGSHLVRNLAGSGANRVRVLATTSPSWLADLNVEVVQGSILDPDSVSRAVEGAHSIYHLAGKVSRTEDDARQMYELHVEGTRLLCRAAVATGVKSMVLASTSGTIAVTEDGEIHPDEDWPPPIDIISRWPYYASKYYQERVATEEFAGEDRRLVIMNPSLLLGPGDDRLSSTRVVLDFLARKIPTVPTGGLSFVDVRDAALAFASAMKNGESGERYLLGSANWTFEKFFGRLERISKVKAPRVSIPSKLAVPGSKMIHALYKHWKLVPPVEPSEIEMANYFWYLDHSKADGVLGFSPRDPSETLHDTVTYIRENFLGVKAFGARL